MLTRCEEIMRKVCEDFETDLIEFNGEEDHVHLLVHYPPKVALSNLVNSLKGVSSRRLRQEYTSRVNRAIMHGRFWSGSYFAGSCGGAPLQVVKDYIENQKQPDCARPQAKNSGAILRRFAPQGSGSDSLPA
jgi:putative transposase